MRRLTCCRYASFSPSSSFAEATLVWAVVRRLRLGGASRTSPKQHGMPFNQNAVPNGSPAADTNVGSLHEKKITLMDLPRLPGWSNG
jgi:hypothetical protein